MLHIGPNWTLSSQRRQEITSLTTSDPTGEELKEVFTGFLTFKWGALHNRSESPWVISGPGKFPNPTCCGKKVFVFELVLKLNFSPPPKSSLHLKNWAWTPVKLSLKSGWWLGSRVGCSSAVISVLTCGAGNLKARTIVGGTSVWEPSGPAFCCSLVSLLCPWVNQPQIKVFSMGWWTPGGNKSSSEIPLCPTQGGESAKETQPRSQPVSNNSCHHQPINPQQPGQVCSGLAGCSELGFV